MQKNTLDGIEQTQAKSTVGSVQGNVNIQAGKDVTIQASDVISGQNTKIIGANVNITAGMETSHEKQSYEYSKSGLTVSVSSPAIDAIQSISNKVDRASEVSDKRLAALYDVQAAQALSGLDKKIDNTVNGTSEKDDKGNDGKKVSDISLNVSLGSTSMQQNSTSDSMQAKGSQISASKNLDIIATGTNKNDGNVIIQGSTVTGDKVHIQAVNDVTIESAENQTSNKTQTDGKSSGIGAQISAKGVGFYAEASKNKELENGTILTHTPSVVTAKDTLKIEAGHDVNILGSKASGDRVEVNAGNNLNLASQQDIDNYNEKSSSSGGKIGTAGIGLQGNASKGKIDSNYESVTTQAEIHAGQGGFNIEVGKNTDLKGAVISSDAMPDKNKISTDTLSYSDIKNKADYSASSIGANYDSKKYSKDDPNYKNQGLTPNNGVTVNGNADSTTKSAITNGTIEVRSNPKQDLSGLNRNTTSALNALGKIFDKKTVQEQQELAALFGQEAFKAVGDLGLKEGSAEKVALDTFVGGVMSKFGGSNFASGAAGAGINQLVMNELKNIKDPAVLQWASAIVGAVAAKLVGGDAQTGASVAASATKNNEDGHPVHDMVNSAMFLTLGYVMTTLADGSQAVVNAAGEVVATLSDAGEWVDSAGNAIGDFKDWVYNKYISYKYDKAVENGEPCPNHQIDDSGDDLPAIGEPNSSTDKLNPDGTVKQRRYYGPDGKAQEDIDYNHSNGDGSHSFPHRHTWDWTQQNPRQ